MNIRQFRYTDLEALIGIAKISFAEEYTSRGETPDNFARQIHMITRGHMIPFKIVSALAGIKWELFVAEVDGKIVGCGSYLGRKQMELSNLMVHPQYRRQGIGQSLLEKRLQHLAERGYPFVTTTILTTNQASLGNVAKQDFELFDRYSVLEIPLPFPQSDGTIENRVFSRSIRSSDMAVFRELEEQISNPLCMQIQGSATTNYFWSSGERLMSQFTNTQRWVRVFVKDNKIIGFLTISTSNNQIKGVLPRPMIAEENLQYLPAMLHEAAIWLTEQGKTTMQMAVPDDRGSLIEELQNSGWSKKQSWVRLVKWLDAKSILIQVRPDTD